MKQLFLQLLNTGITASWVVLAVLILRLCMKKAPRWLTCSLWAVVGLRLIWPFSVKSSFSLVPSTQTIPVDVLEKPQLHSGIAAVDKVVNPTITEQYSSAGAATLQTVLQICTIAWLVGIAVMLLYSIFCSAHLYHSVAPSIRLRDNIRICDNIDTPFILGVFSPQIYLPSDLPPEQMEAVLAHERAHLQRKDHWWKPLSFLLLAVHWYNPVLWLAYILLCRDIELSCDEKVIKTMDVPGKKAYSEALLACSCTRRIVAACPLAFGEVGVKARIKAVLHYKKPAVWIIAGSLLVAMLATVCLLTDTTPCVHAYAGDVALNATCKQTGMKIFTCDHCGDSYKEDVDMLVHQYDAGTVTQASTCTQEGKQEFACTACGHAKTDPLPLDAHTCDAAFVSKAPNCTETGVSSGICLDCGQEHLIEILPVNEEHDMQEEVIRAATCSEDGEGLKTCNRCSKTETCTYAKLGHDYEVGLTIAATCFAEGCRQETCKNCGKEQWYFTPKDTSSHYWKSPGFNWPTYCSACGTIKRDD